jgi:hypothetical protein
MLLRIVDAVILCLMGHGLYCIVDYHITSHIIITTFQCSIVDEGSESAYNCSELQYNI